MTVETDGAEPTRSWIAITAVLALAAFLAVIDGSVVTTILTGIGDTFHARLSDLVWVTMAYLIAGGITQPLSGWLATRFGGRRIFLVALVIFLLASLLATLAWSLWSLVAFRALQGLGGGLLEPAAIGLAARSAPDGAVGRVMGLFSLVINIAPVVGPLIGALLSTDPQWRAVFALNVPIGIVALLLAVRFVPRDTDERAEGAVDLIGLLLLPASVVAILFALNRIGTDLPAGIVVAVFVVGVILLTLFVIRARRDDRRKAPVLDVRLLGDRRVRASLFVMSAVGVVMYGQLVALPLFGRSRFGFTGVEGGILVAALGVGLLLSMANAARLSDRTGPRVLVVSATAASAVLAAVFALIARTAPLPALLIVLTFLGVAFGAVAAPAFASIYRVVEPGDIPHGTALLFVVVQTSAAASAAVVGVILANADGVPIHIVYAILAVVLVLASVAARALPGPAPRSGADTRSDGPGGSEKANGAKAVELSAEKRT